MAGGMPFAPKGKAPAKGKPAKAPAKGKAKGPISAKNLKSMKASLKAIG